MGRDFHGKSFDAGTLAKLRIFELYTQEWIPVFLSTAEPQFDETHIFDFFAGPGTDAAGVYGSPLRILEELRNYNAKGLAGWAKVRKVVHLFDQDAEKIGSLKSILLSPEWNIPGVEIDCRPLEFQNALMQHQTLLSNRRIAKLLIIDQCGVDAISDPVFAQLIGFPTTDFIFFISSSTLHRFRGHPAIKQKIGKVADSYNVHRAVVDYYRGLIPPNNRLFLGSFSIRKRSNIYGLIFGSHHPLGIHKFLQVAWATDEIAGEANFDIEHDNIRPEEGILSLDVMRPNKIRQFERELEVTLMAGKLRSEADVVRFCLEAGMTCKHSSPVLKMLRATGSIDLDFRVPDVGRINNPRPIRICGAKL
jgi:three-Cys-motif partner protein